MNEIKIIVKFEKHQCDFEKHDDIKSLISGDYNSTKLIFEFDREDGTKIFEMKNPKGELVFADEIVNNEVILVGRDEQGNNCSLFTTAGTYPFEISLYGDDSKLTSESNCFSVQQEQVEIDGKVVEFYMPIFDKLLNDVQDSLESVNSAIDEVDTLDIDVNKSGTTTTVELTKKDGTTKSVEILDGEKGEKGDTGEQGIQGEKGDNATINGVNTLNIVAGTNINLSQSGSTLTISTDTEENVQSDWNQADSTKDDYIKNKPTKLSDFTDDLGSSPVHTHSQYLTEHQDISMKQNIEDNTLNTNNKTVPSAINEVNSIAKGANQALSYSNYQSMINVFNNLANNVYNVGQNVMIVTLEVPDLWISGIESTSQTYTYTTDEAFTTELATNGYVQVGYYKVSALETQKVDLTNYVTFTSYPSGATAGVIKTSDSYGTQMLNGALASRTKSYNDYLSSDTPTFVSKGTLENVITGKGLISNTNYATSSNGGVLKIGYGLELTENGTSQAKIFDYNRYITDLPTVTFISKGTLENVITGKDLTTKSYVDELVGDIDSVLDAINGEVI